ncbi:MAG: aminotransferase class III-fold pyridoxal phosphate-dependent enzyme [Bacteroidota bacterium]
MKLFDVYPLLDITPAKGEGSYLYDDKGVKYLDLYGGHAVISIGHSHPVYVKAISEQVSNLGFYSNSVQIPVQQKLAAKLGELSGYDDYNLFLCNSGAEAVENAVKLASYHNGRKKIISFKNGFHGRTSLAASITNSSKITAPVNEGHKTEVVEIGDLNAIEQLLVQQDVAAVIIEGIQGIAGIYEPDASFLEKLGELCKKYGSLLILDEIQSGYGRSGKFFAHQYSKVKPDLITIAKGMGNGFPVGGVLISPEIEASFGLLGTTFGGNHLACAASLAVLEVMESENLIDNANEVGNYLIEKLKTLPNVEVRGKGLMIGVEFQKPIKSIRTALLNDHKIFTGVASNPNVLRLLPPLSLTKEEADSFINALKSALYAYK